MSTDRHLFCERRQIGKMQSSLLIYLARTPFFRLSLFLTGMLEDKCKIVCQIHFEKSPIRRLKLTFIFAFRHTESQNLFNKVL